MPPNDPSLWRMIVDALEQMRAFIAQEVARPYHIAPALSFIVALCRARLAGGKVSASILEACLCGALTLAVFPLLEYFGLNANLAIAAGSAIAFLGVEWFRTYMADAAARMLDRIIDKRDDK